MATALEQQILERIAAGTEPLALATAVAVQGSAPCKTGFKLLVHSDGRILGSIGGGKLEQLVIADALSALADGKPLLKTYNLTEAATGMWCGGEATVFIEPYLPPARLWIFGFGHLGREVLGLAERCGFSVRVVHEAAQEGVEIALFDWSTLSPFPAIAPGDYVLLLTMDAGREMAVVAKLAPDPPCYIGIAGSKTKAAKLKQELAAQGIEVGKLNLHIPVGLDIAARNAAEIAVSIVSELIKVRNAG